jgi:uncharacterized membrane protein
VVSNPSAAPHPDADRAAHPRTIGFICAALGALGFSFKAIFVKAAYRYGVDAETLLCLRMAYALPLLCLMALALERHKPATLTRHDWQELFVLGLLGYYLASYLDFLGLRYISAALERIVMFVYPTLVAVLSALFLGKALTRRTALLLLWSYVGVALAVAPDLRFAAGNTLLGVALVFGSALSYAIYLMRSGPTALRRLNARHRVWHRHRVRVVCAAIHPVEAARSAGAAVAGARAGARDVRVFDRAADLVVHRGGAANGRAERLDDRLARADLHDPARLCAAARAGQCGAACRSRGRDRCRIAAHAPLTQDGWKAPHSR